MYILGAGLTACLAGMYNQHADILCPQPRGELKQHRAILRFPNADIERITGVKCKKVQITKSIYEMGKHVEPDIRVANAYSKKVTGGYYDRSINNIDPVTRWIPPDNFHDIMLDILKDRISYGVDLGTTVFKNHRPIVSTLPISKNCEIAGLDLPEMESKYRSIYVSKYAICDCDVWHTVYYPDNQGVYRASVEGNLLTIESVEPIIEADAWCVLNSMGIEKADSFLIEKNYKQSVGKIIPIDDTIRKDTIKRLTLDYNLYSLGRWATWRSIQLNDVVKDLGVIHRLINENEYDLMVGK